MTSHMATAMFDIIYLATGDTRSTLISWMYPVLNRIYLSQMFYRYVRMVFTNKLEFTQWLQASNIPSGLTSTQYDTTPYHEYKPPEELGLL